MMDQNNKMANRRYWMSVIAVLIFAMYALSSFGIYCARALNGKSANHILIGEMFGMPDAIKARGVQPMYYGPGQTGWDGQFYFYMANDVLGRKDTPAHVDAPSYRYQRIGLSLYANTVSKLAGRDWVSPNFYLVSYFALLLAATWAGARIFAGLGASPLWILFWSLSVGTQVTLFNGLPDAAADAFLILAVWALLRQRIALSVIPFALAGLSREVYVLFPVCIVACLGWERLVEQRRSGVSLAGRIGALVWQKGILLLIPAIVVVAWQAYVIAHFNATPSSQAHGILGAPFAAWFRYLMSGLRGHHLLVQDSVDAYYEAGSLILFAAVLLSGAWTAARTLTRAEKMQQGTVARGMALALLAFALMYACFGKTVIMHYTGYIKALAVFFFVLPFLLCQRGLKDKHSVGLVALLAVTLAFTTLYNFRARLLPVNGNPFQTAVVNETRRIECIERYQAEIRIKDVTFTKSDLIAQPFGAKDQVAVQLELTNRSDKPFESSKNFGGIFMSYQWTDARGTMIQDGLRTPLPTPLQPGQTVTLDIRSTLPDARGMLTMVPSPVQEGCAWFHLVNPAIAAGTKVRVAN